MSEKIHAIMESDGMDRREQLEQLAMMCSDVAKCEGPDCYDFVERVMQAWIVDQRDKSLD